MREVILAAILGAAPLAGAGCRASAPPVKVGPGADLMRFRRIGVLPLDEPHGDGIKSAEVVEQAIRKLGIATVEPSQMAPVFSALRLERGSELGLEQLLTVRQATQADALVFGSIAPGKKAGTRRLSLLIIDGQTGELVAKGEGAVPPDDEGGLEAGVDSLVDAIRDAILKERREPAAEKLEEP